MVEWRRDGSAPSAGSQEEASMRGSPVSGRWLVPYAGRPWSGEQLRSRV